jgi:EAL domain-containing protein (putative c-di-GMP-specific phosphodiesterase class I)/GGDEF domain-containing protein
MSFSYGVTPSVRSAETIDELWSDAIDDDAFVHAALRISTELFDVPMAVMQIASSDSRWYEYCVTGRQFGHAFFETSFAGFSVQAKAGERAAFVSDIAGLWCVPAGVLPSTDSWIRFCAHIPLASSDGMVAGSLWLLDTRPRIDFESLQGTLLLDTATMIVARFQALHAFRYRDRLTHLGNRTQFVRDIRACMQRRSSSGGNLHAVVIDIGSLPMISRMVVAMGLANVERSIQTMTQRLIAQLPSEIRLYKIGHARFSFLLADDIDVVCALASRCAACFEQPLTVEDAFPIALSACAGIVSIEDVDSAADAVSALFAVSEQARATGKASLVYDCNIAAAQQRAFSIVNSMPTALSSLGQLRLVYQPRERMSDGAWVAAEALIRWRHPRLGDLSPGEILPLIEATSLMPRLTDWVINEAVRQVAEWNRRTPNFKVSINVSPTDFGKTDFADVLCAALARHRANSANVEIEITETAVATDPERSQLVLKRLKRAGISVAIDDFGVGHSSLSRWQTFSFNTLKIDGALVRDALDNDRAEAIFQWVISLAKKLGQKVVAEGVETAAQRWVAERWGCDEAQGYFVSHPLEAPVLTARLECKHRSIDDLPIQRKPNRDRSNSIVPRRLSGLRRTIFAYLGLR